MQKAESQIFEFVGALHTLAAPGEEFSLDFGLREHATGRWIQANLSNIDVLSANFDKTIKYLRFQNARGWDVYTRPARGIMWGYVFLDDLALESAMEIVEGTGAAYVLVETSSPGLHHLWLRTEKIDEAERKKIQSAFVERGLGDPGSASGEHFGRVPGFKSWKRGCWVNLISVDLSGAALSPSPLAFDFSPPKGWRVCSSGFEGQPVNFPAARRQVVNSESVESHREFSFACESLKAGVRREKVIENISRRALGRGKRKTLDACSIYAARTVAAAELAITLIFHTPT